MQGTPKSIPQKTPFHSLPEALKIIKQPDLIRPPLIREFVSKSPFQSKFFYDFYDYQEGENQVFKNRTDFHDKSNM